MRRKTEIRRRQAMELALEHARIVGNGRVKSWDIIVAADRYFAFLADGTVPPLELVVTVPNEAKKAQ